jgi:hypothetical protein
MHTVMVIGVGLVSLAVFLLAGRAFGGGSPAAAARAVPWFIPVWLIATAFNFYVGTRHGHSAAEELPIALVVFGVPAAAAFLFRRRFARRD